MSSRARSVEITKSSRVHSRGWSCIRSACRAPPRLVGNTIRIRRCRPRALGQQFGRKALSLRDPLHLYGHGVQRLLHLRKALLEAQNAIAILERRPASSSEPLRDDGDEKRRSTELPHYRNDHRVSVHPSSELPWTTQKQPPVRSLAGLGKS